jgi:hypothetical protein
VSPERCSASDIAHCERRSVAQIRLASVLGSASNAIEHPLEHDPVKRQHRVPLREPEQTSRLEPSGLHQYATADGVPARTHAKTQHGLSRELHLGAQLEPPVALDARHAPEIERLSVRNRLGAPTGRGMPDLLGVSSGEPRRAYNSMLIHCSPVASYPGFIRGEDYTGSPRPLGAPCSRFDLQ